MVKTLVGHRSKTGVGGEEKDICALRESIPIYYVVQPVTRSVTEPARVVGFQHFGGRIKNINKDELCMVIVGRDSSLGIGTRYGLDDPEIESSWDEIFPIYPDRPWGPPSLLYNGYLVSFPEVKQPGRGIKHPPPASRG